MKRLLALTLLLSAPALAEDVPTETVTVKGSTLVGIWQIETPRTPTIGKKTVWHPAQTRYCRVAAAGGELVVNCLDFAGGSVEEDHDKFHFAWGSFLAREVLDATLISASRFEGRSALKLSGVEMGSDDITTGMKLTIKPDSTDIAGKGGLLAHVLEQLQNGVQVAVQQLPSSIRTLGAVKVITYLGKANQTQAKNQPIDLSVYGVAFADGERICGLHQRDDGTIDVLRCV